MINRAKNIIEFVIWVVVVLILVVITLLWQLIGAIKRLVRRKE